MSSYHADKHIQDRIAQLEASAAILREALERIRDSGFSVGIVEARKIARDALLRAGKEEQPKPSAEMKMREAIQEAANLYRPYVDESGIIEIPLHTFGRLINAAGIKLREPAPKPEVRTCKTCKNDHHFSTCTLKTCACNGCSPDTLKNWTPAASGEGKP